MHKSTQSLVIQACLALVCALGAGFSGDMQSRVLGHGHHGRHARGNHHRGARASGRDTQGEHAHEVELVKGSNPANDAAQPGLSAVLPQSFVLAFAWTSFGIHTAVQAGFPQSVVDLQLPARAPPSVA